MTPQEAALLRFALQPRPQREEREIGRVMIERSAEIQTPYDRARFERDFADPRWFISHPFCWPVAELYYWDFLENRYKEIH